MCSFWGPNVAKSVSVLVGQFSTDSDFKAAVDFTSERNIRDFVERLMAVQFVPVVLRHEPPKAQQAKQNEGNLQECLFGRQFPFSQLGQ